MTQTPPTCLVQIKIQGMIQQRAIYCNNVAESDSSEMLQPAIGGASCNRFSCKAS